MVASLHANAATRQISASAGTGVQGLALDGESVEIAKLNQPFIGAFTVECDDVCAYSRIVLHDDGRKQAANRTTLNNPPRFDDFRSPANLMLAKGPIEGRRPVAPGCAVSVGGVKMHISPHAQPGLSRGLGSLGLRCPK